MATISKLDFELPDALESLKLSLNDEFKDIAKESVDNYTHTNKRFEELVTTQEKTMHDFKNQTINVDQIKDKFDAIKTHMLDEVNRANNVISDLKEKIVRLEISTQIDHLTKVYNRGMLSQHLENLCNNKSYVKDIHLYMIDIDDFKNINDTYGHIVGDKVLIFLANILRKTLRDGDKIYRYGGEEFVVILNRMQRSECLKVAQRIVSLVDTNKLIYKEINVSLTISLGITSLKNGDTPDSFIARADKALYEAKRNGKNRIEMDCEQMDI
jgi:diguanylate cyclase (GGDEF)-like protein